MFILLVLLSSLFVMAADPAAFSIVVKPAVTSANSDVTADVFVKSNSGDVKINTPDVFVKHDNPTVLDFTQTLTLVEQISVNGKPYALIEAAKDPKTYNYVGKGSAVSVGTTPVKLFTIKFKPTATGKINLALSGEYSSGVNADDEPIKYQISGNTVLDVSDATCKLHTDCKDGKCVIKPGETAGVCGGGYNGICYKNDQCSSGVCVDSDGKTPVSPNAGKCAGGDSDPCDNDDKCVIGKCVVVNGKGECSSGSGGTACNSEGDCAAGNYCESNVCKAKVTEGGSCSADNQCVSGKCTNGKCEKAGADTDGDGIPDNQENPLCVSKVKHSSTNLFKSGPYKGCIKGDIFIDFTVNAKDITWFIDYYGQRDKYDKTKPLPLDFDINGIIDSKDITGFIDAYALR